MTLVESMAGAKADYNLAMDAVSAKVTDETKKQLAIMDANRASANAGFDNVIDQMTKLANDFPATLVTSTASTQTA